MRKLIKLQNYINSLTPEAQEKFASDCGTKMQYLRNNISLANNRKQKILGAILCVRIEKYSLGRVTRKDLRDDYLEVWPELAERKAS